MIALHIAAVAVGTATYALFLTGGESRLFAAGMALTTAFLTVHLTLT